MCVEFSVKFFNLPAIWDLPVVVFWTRTRPSAPPVFCNDSCAPVQTLVVGRDELNIRR